MLSIIDLALDTKDFEWAKELTQKADEIVKTPVTPIEISFEKAVNLVLSGKKVKIVGESKIFGKIETIINPKMFKSFSLYTFHLVLTSAFLPTEFKDLLNYKYYEIK